MFVCMCVSIYYIHLLCMCVSIYYIHLLACIQRGFFFFYIHLLACIQRVVSYGRRQMRLLS